MNSPDTRNHAAQQTRHRPRFPAMTMNLRMRRLVGQLGLSLVFILLLLGHVAGWYSLGMVARLESALYDFKARQHAIPYLDERVAIVDIDEKSLQALGRWPWSRDVMGRLTTSLFEQYGVAAVGYDIIFAEPDASSGLPVLEKLAAGPLAGEAGFQDTLDRLRPRLDYDGKLAEALAKGPSVLGFYFSFGERPDKVGALPQPLLDCAELHRHGIRPLRATGYNANLPRLQARAQTAAFFNMQADFDGVARRMPVVIEHDGKCYGSLALRVTQAAMGVPAPRLLPPAGGRPASLLLGDLSLPLDGAGMAQVPYRRQGAFEYISATDVLKGVAPAAKLEGRLVLIGSTAPGLMDLRATPISHVFPGVEIHANLISGLLDGTVKWSPARLTGLMMAAILVLGLALAILLPLAPPLWAALGILAVTGLLWLGETQAWAVWHLHLPLAALYVVVIGLFVLNMSYGFFVEARTKAQITRLFGQYVPPELVDEMAKDPARYSLRGESRVMTVLFSDIVGFTSISEGLEASRLAAMLNVFLSHMTRLIQHNRGTIDKYIGDAIMAFWGAPMSDDQHARDAVLTGLAMQSTLAELNPRLEAEGWPPVRIGVGINTGRMSVGNMGSEFRMAYTVMADAVNLASRLEALTRQYGVGILVGEDTRAACSDILFMRVDKVRVKGKALPVAIHYPLGLEGQVAREDMEWARGFEEALGAYLARDWDGAEARLRRLEQSRPHPLHQVYLARIAHYRVEPPPPDWDGAYTYTTK